MSLVDAEKAYKAKEYDKAVEIYGDLCASYASENDREDPDLLFCYGKALFKVAVRTSTLLYEEAVDKKQSVEPVDEENFAFASDDDEIDKAEGDNSDGDKASESNDAKDENDESRHEGDEQPEEAEDKDEDDFEAAWHVLDVCRALLESQIESEHKEDVEHKLADTYALLGEIAIEDDNYPQAAVDFASALALKEKLYAPDARELSEANYMLGLAYEFKAETPEDSENALKHLKAALSIAKAADTDAESIQELEQKVSELESEIAAGKAHRREISDAAGGIAGRDAIKGVLEQMMSGAADINTLVRKRKPKDTSGIKKKSKRE